MFTRVDRFSVRTACTGFIALFGLLVGTVRPAGAQPASKMPPIVLGRTIAFRPLNAKNMKQGLKYQLFETTVSAHRVQDSVIRDSLVTVNDVVLTKDTSGYVISSTPKAVNHFLNDKLLTDPVSKLMIGVTGKLHLNGLGMAVEFSGTDDVEKKIRTTFSADSAAMLLKGINKVAISQRTTGEWNGRMRNLLNRAIVIGEAKFDTAQMQFPNGHRLPSYTISRIEDTIRIAGIWHLKVRISAATNPADLANVSGMSMKEIIRGFKLADSTLRSYPLSKGTMTMRTDLLLEMSTMLLKTEEFTRTFRMEPEISEKGEPVFTQETSYRRTLRYQY